MAGKSVESYEKLSFFSVFIRLRPFPQVFGQGKEWLMLELYKIKIVSYVVACPIVFIWVYDQDWQKVIKNCF